MHEASLPHEVVLPVLESTELSEVKKAILNGIRHGDAVGIRWRRPSEVSKTCLESKRINPDL